MITPELVNAVRAKFKLNWHGIHGANHWARVRENGLRLAEQTEANTAIVEAFAFIHDACRLEDGYDPHHGARAAAFAEQLRADGVLKLVGADFRLLVFCVTHHSDGRVCRVEVDPTVGTCWDADRLDLGRTGRSPQAAYLSTDAAKAPALVAWAYERSVRRASNAPASEAIKWL